MKNDILETNPNIDNISEALSIYINQLVYSEKRKGIDIITLSLGEAFFDIPQFSFEKINFIKGYHYSDSLGLPELRKKILDYYNKQYLANIASINNIMISCGSKAIIYMIMLLLLNNESEVLIHEPAWLSYQEQLKLLNAKPVFIPFDCKIERFPNYISNKTKLLILNNPNNPAGWVYTKDMLIELHNLCKKKGIYILVDEAYSDFIGEKEQFVSIAAITDKLEKVFIVNSLSKNMGMSGWRIGYTIAEEKMISKLLKLNQHIITCAPTVLQMYLATYFDDIMNITIPQVKEVVKKRKKIIEYIDSIGLNHLKGESTFYIFINVENLRVSTLDFCLYLLLKYGISTVPGGAYGKSTELFIRISIGAESEERIKRAIDIIKLVYRKHTTDIAYVDNKLKEKGYHKFIKAN